MVTFVPEYLTEIDRADEIESSKEKKRLRALYPKDKGKVKEGMAAWRELHPDPHHSTLLDVADHIDHIRKVAGIDCVGIGSDFEGFDNPPRGLEDVTCYPALLAELLKRGYSEDDIKKVAGLNVLASCGRRKRFRQNFRRMNRMGSRIPPAENKRDP